MKSVSMLAPIYPQKSARAVRRVTCKHKTTQTSGPPNTMNTGC
jgi:hypothetical protein